MMRSIRILFLLLVAVYCSSVVAKPMLKATFPSTTMYYGIGPNSDKSIVVEVTIATPEGVYYGSWNLGDIVKVIRYPPTPGLGQNLRRRLY